MQYKPDGEPVKLEGVQQVAEAARQNGGVVLCFVPTEYQAQLESFPSIKVEVIANNGRVTLMAIWLK
jgi:hypothetical protein